MITKLYNGNPNPREIQRIVNILSQGGIAVLPTDEAAAGAAGSVQRELLVRRPQGRAVQGKDQECPRHSRNG